MDEKGSPIQALDSVQVFHLKHPFSHMLSSEPMRPQPKLSTTQLEWPKVPRFYTSSDDGNWAALVTAWTLPGPMY